MSDKEHEKRKKRIFSRHTTRHRPETFITPKLTSEEARTGKVRVKSPEKTKVKVKIGDKGTVREDRFLFK